MNKPKMIMYKSLVSGSENTHKRKGHEDIKENFCSLVPKSLAGVRRK
jgi:hypothetical protein